MNPPGRPRSKDRIVVEKLLEKQDRIDIRRAARDGTLAIPLERVRRVLKEIRRTKLRAIKKESEGSDDCNREI